FANDDQIGKVAFVDPTMGLVFQSAFIGSAVFDGTTATIEGTGFIAGAFGQFRIVLQDLANPGVGKDTFSIELSTGVKISGAITARRAGARVTGLDLTPELLTVAKENAAIAELDDITWKQGDVEDLPFRDGEFDVVLSQFAHIFAPRPEVAIGQMLRVLKPGG